MKIPQNPFNDALQTCLNNIEEFKKRVEKESELKNSLLSQMANFYTDNFQNTYFKEEKTKRIGQIEYIFSKNGVFFAHVYFLDITTNSKIRKVYEYSGLRVPPIRNGIPTKRRMIPTSFLHAIRRNVLSVRK